MRRWLPERRVFFRIDELKVRKSQVESHPHPSHIQSPALSPSREPKCTTGHRRKFDVSAEAMAVTSDVNIWTNKHSTSGPPEVDHHQGALSPFATGWHRGGCEVGIWTISRGSPRLSRHLVPLTLLSAS